MAFLLLLDRSLYVGTLSTSQQKNIVSTRKK